MRARHSPHTPLWRAPEKKTQNKMKRPDLPNGWTTKYVCAHQHACVCVYVCELVEMCARVNYWVPSVFPFRLSAHVISIVASLRRAEMITPRCRVMNAYANIRWRQTDTLSGIVFAAAPCCCIRKPKPERAFAHPILRLCFFASFCSLIQFWRPVK